MTRRLLIPLLLVVGVIAVAVVLLGGRDSYTIRAQFDDAGQLVTGGLVKLAGRDVGSIGDIEITDDGHAEVELHIDDDALTPLHVGTRVAIRSIGPATITNRYVALSPGPRTARTLDDGAVLPTTQTTGIVNLDEVLNTFDEPTRASIQGLIAGSSKIFAGSGAPEFGAMLAKFAPAAGEVAAAAGDLASDQADLRELLGTAAAASAAVAARQGDLQQALTSSSRWLGSVAGARRELAETLTRAPGVLRDAQRTLGGAETAIGQLRPALRAIPDAAKPLDGFLREATPALSGAGPVVRDLNRQLPALRRSFDGFTPLSKQAVPALDAVGGGLKAAQPILTGLRIYAPDFVLGIVNGLAGVASGNYNQNGHYARLEFIQNAQTTLGGRFATLLTGQPLIPDITGVRTGLTARCAGGNAPPAPDGSNPYVPDPSLCDPNDNIPAYVNQPTGTSTSEAPVTTPAPAAARAAPSTRSTPSSRSARSSAGLGRTLRTAATALQAARPILQALAPALPRPVRAAVAALAKLERQR